MGLHAHHLPRWRLLACFSIHTLAHVQHQHDLGCDYERSYSHNFLRRSPQGPQKVQIHLPFLLHCDRWDDRSGWSWPTWTLGPIRLANRSIHHRVAPPHVDSLSPLVANCIESGIDVVHMVERGAVLALFISFLLG